ncbi:MAG TPA: SoxR reducing system RseC family protein [Bacteroidales bacterium]|nr:SoxR reducing system RseC family protein [Bacteroidales bacterium]
MSNNEMINHKGIIEKIDNNKAFVKIIVQSACATCKVKTICTLSDTKEKIIEVNITDPEKYKTGQNVVVSMYNYLGIKALFLGYIFPFIILLATLITLSLLNFNELFAGIFSIVILIPYYLILYFYRNKLKRTFSFSIKPLT